jgi:hypothetical protein
MRQSLEVRFASQIESLVGETCHRVTTVRGLRMASLEEKVNTAGCITRASSVGAISTYLAKYAKMCTHFASVIILSR